MCYLVRHRQARAQRDAAASSPPAGRLRPRWAGAIAATLVGGLAMAALVDPSWTPPSGTERDPTAPPPMVERSLETTTTAAFGAPVVEQTAAQIDDGVPTASTDLAKASVGGCHHGL